MAGSFQGNVDFGGLTLSSANGSNDIFIAKYPANCGGVQWARNLGSSTDDVGYGLAVAGNGDVVMTGYFSGSINFGTGTVLSNGPFADVFVVNKADRDGADQTARDLKYMISLGRRDREGPLWRPPVVKTVAARMEGLDRVVEAIAEHQEWMASHGELEERRLRRAAAEIEAIAVERVRTRFGAVDQLAKRVVSGELDPFAAAEQLISGNLPE